MTSEHGGIIAESNDPYRTKIKEHLDYHKLNENRGRMPGQLRIRARYTPRFDYAMVCNKTGNHSQRNWLDDKEIP